MPAIPSPCEQARDDPHERLRGGGVPRLAARRHVRDGGSARLGEEIMLRNALPRGSDPPAELPVEGRAMIEAQAPKRVGLEFVERRRASFDHRKLGGAY